ncbi:hypothetical protein P9112_008741 [Eukaryota sp. TZLM1-RC]
MLHVSSDLRSFLQKTALQKFLHYVTFDTTADELSHTVPSSAGQTELARFIYQEILDLGYSEDYLILDDSSTLYCTIPATSETASTSSVSFLAHLDTSPEAPGDNVTPVIHKNYDGEPIFFSKNDSLVLAPKHHSFRTSLGEADSGNLNLFLDPDLHRYIGRDIITASGNSLLGADDKAGVASLMAVLAAIKKYDLPHGLIQFVFTCDEEIGKGTDHLKYSLLHDFAFTVDGAREGTMEYECFDAWRASVTFKGRVVHPSIAKNKMVNSILEASRYVSQIYSSSNILSPDQSSGREGFVYVTEVEGNCEESVVKMIIRSFSEAENERVRGILTSLATHFESSKPGLSVDVAFTHQYANMVKHFSKAQELIEFAKDSISESGLDCEVVPIRGGTDGSRLTENGVLCPNLFTGGHLFHSRLEYIPADTLGKSAEVVLRIINKFRTCSLKKHEVVLEGTLEIDDVTCT